MPTAQKDERLWLIKVCMENVDCPFLLYEDAIERAWEYYKSLQDDYRKLTGRQHEWLK